MIDLEEGLNSILLFINVTLWETDKEEEKNETSIYPVGLSG